MSYDDLHETIAIRTANRQETLMRIVLDNVKELVRWLPLFKPLTSCLVGAMC